MKHNGIIAIVFVIGCATGGVAAHLVVPPVRAGTLPTRWEYHCARAVGGPEVASGLNQLDAEGWELASMAYSGKVEAYLLCGKKART